jgi:hypothetical protein
MNLDTKGFQQHASNVVNKINELIPNGELLNILEEKYQENFSGDTVDFLANIETLIEDLRMIAVMVTCINWDDKD